MKINALITGCAKKWSQPHVRFHLRDNFLTVIQSIICTMRCRIGIKLLNCISYMVSTKYLSYNMNFLMVLSNLQQITE